MLKTRHTPGPWLIIEASRTDTLINTADGHTVALITTDGDNDLTEEDGANARLIAAAPDLVAACEKVLDNYTSYLTSGEGPRSIIPSMEQLRVVVASTKGA